MVANKKTLLLLSVSLFIRKALEKCRIVTSQLCKEKKKEKKMEKKKNGRDALHQRKQRPNFLLTSLKPCVDYSSRAYRLFNSF